MKKAIFTVLLVLAFAPVLFAQRERSTLHVTLSDQSHLSVALNGRYFDKHGTSLTIGDLPGGQHFLKVYTYEQDGRGRGHAHLVYSGYIRIHRGTYANCVVDPNTGDIQLNEEGENDNTRYSYSHRERGYVREQDGQYDDNGPVTDDIYDNGKDYGDDKTAERKDNSNESAIGAFGTGPMSKGDMDGLKSMVRAKDTDGDKIQVLESQTKGKSFTVEQVSKMMSWMNADDSKLEFAEWAYPFVTDKENYRKLGGQFAKADYLKQLDDFVQSRR